LQTGGIGIENETRTGLGAAPESGVFGLLDNILEQNNKNG